MTVDSLRLFGYDVLDASRGEDALEFFKNYTKRKIDLLITDVVMPDLSGSDLAKMLLKGYPGLNILFISGYTDETIFHHGVIDEGMPLLQKPFSPHALARKVREILDSEKQ